jgi:hypothetical protein
MPSAEALLCAFCETSHPNHRYASFDYCFNYFHSFGSKSQIVSANNIEKSCMELGAYLASWGMFRASGFLLKRKSMRHFEGVIRAIASKELAALWDIDCDNYDQKAKIQLLSAYQIVRDQVVPADETHLTLVTKILLGVFGCVPAFDTRFTDTMRTYGKQQGWSCRFRSFNVDALDRIAAFYVAHDKVIDPWARKTRTFDFGTGKPGKLSYTKAKIVDMIGFEARGRDVTDA